MSKKIEMTGKRFGRLTVLTDAGRDAQQNALWLCVCDCGNKKVVRGYNMRNGATLSCGCLQKEHAHTFNLRHGGYESRLYRVWQAMKHRCHNPHDKRYKDYGGRGIKVCDEWGSFVAFREWALNNGYDDGLQIDRIDNDDGYRPENCRFVTPKENMLNRRNSYYLTLGGKRQSLSSWAVETGLQPGTIRTRIIRGWSVEKALTTPPKIKGNKEETL